MEEIQVLATPFVSMFSNGPVNMSDEKTNPVEATSYIFFVYQFSSGGELDVTTVVGSSIPNMRHEINDPDNL